MRQSLVIFDLDGTLAESKSLLDEEMADLLRSLLDLVKVAVISGASFSQFQKQFLASLNCSDDCRLSKLFLLPTNGSSLHQFRDGEWQVVYEEPLQATEITKIKQVFESVLPELDFVPKQGDYGGLVEDRGSQVTYSALGQEAPLSLKKDWDPDHQKRDKIKEIISPLLPEFEIKIAGSTSIDVTKKGIDKAYGINKLMSHLGLLPKDVLFIGDAVFPGGNDYSAIKTGVQVVKVPGPSETKTLIRLLLDDSVV